MEQRDRRRKDQQRFTSENHVQSARLDLPSFAPSSSLSNPRATAWSISRASIARIVVQALAAASSTTNQRRADGVIREPTMPAMIAVKTLPAWLKASLR